MLRMVQGNGPARASDEPPAMLPDPTGLERWVVNERSRIRVGPINVAMRINTLGKVLRWQDLLQDTPLSSSADS